MAQKSSRSHRKVMEMRIGHSSIASSFLIGCVTGLVIGSALGLLLAPQKGEISRQQIRYKINSAKSNGKRSESDDETILDHEAVANGTDSVKEN